ncbi:hypothetical protein NMK71_03080 [Weeksellaceae bacterium KMM 9713]|uniref:Uncharacterized protein n=1 Tax=Profundicola chukchiensis TaxID=2961959 RepID=A0A9X4MZM1_9FLAO|nr:hypothetical protein [Profundicola chukchiensis]
MMMEVPETTNLFDSGIIIFFSFLFYLLIYRKIFIQQHIKFISLNIDRYKSILLKKIGVSIIYFVISSILVLIALSFIFEKPSWLSGLFQIKYILFFLLLNLMCSLISFAITSFNTSIWMVLIILSLVLFEDNIRLMIENATITNLFFKTNYKNLFSEASIYAVITTVIYILIPFFIILKKNYKHEN